MIITTHVEVTITKQATHFASLGYDITGLGSGSGQKLLVAVKDLPRASHYRIDCRCDDCDKDYQATARNALHQEVNRCVSCNRKHIIKNHCADKLYTEETLNKRRDPNASELRKYRVAVARETRKNWKLHEDVINPFRLPRTLSGVLGGYQLDHRVPVAWGFKWGINPKVIGGLDNLQMLPWKKNIQKDVGFRNRRKKRG